MKSPCGISGKGVLEPLKRVYTDLKTNMIMFLIIFISLLVPKTWGVKDPVSASSTLCWYFRVFFSSCSLKIVDCFSLITLGFNMPYSDIEKFCNSSRPKAPSLHVQSYLRVCHWASDVKLLIIGRL